MCYLVNKPGGKVRSIEFEWVLRMTMEYEERKALMIYVTQYMKSLDRSKKSVVNYCIQEKLGSSHIDHMIGLGQINRFFA